MTIPRATQPFVDFAQALRTHGFRVAPEQVTSWLAAIGLLGPRDMRDLRRAAHATLAPPHDRQALFDALFDRHFLGVGGREDGPTDTEEIVARDDDGVPELARLGEQRPSGQRPAILEALATRSLRGEGDDATLARFRRALPAGLPHRRGYRRRAAHSGPTIDVRRMMQDAVRHDGEALTLPRRSRKPRPRRILLLIDVSGSMKARTDANLRFAHALVQAAPRVEVFAFGTRLTRLTRALRLRHRAQALAEAAAQVPDWDGGTRIGDALAAFLAIPRFAGQARGAHALIVSDGLERGDPATLVAAVRALRARAWRLDWLTPLASDPRYRPETAAMRAIVPMLDALRAGHDTASLCRAVLRTTNPGNAHAA